MSKGTFRRAPRLIIKEYNAEWRIRRSAPKDFHSIVSRDRREMRFLTFCFRESEINGAISDLFAKYPVPYVVRFDREDAGRYVSLFRELCGVIDDESTAQDRDISRMLVMSVIEHMILFAAARGITSGDISRENPTGRPRTTSGSGAFICFSRISTSICRGRSAVTSSRNICTFHRTT